METPLRGKTAPLLSVLPYFFVCGPENGQGPFSELRCNKDTPSGTSQGEVLSPCLLRWQANARFCTCHFGQQSTFVERTRYRYSGGSKGGRYDPLRWRSRNQEVPCAPFVHFLAIGNGPRGAGAGSLPANRSCRDYPAKKGESPLEKEGISPPSPYKRRRNLPY